MSIQPTGSELEIAQQTATVLEGEIVEINESLAELIKAKADLYAQISKIEKKIEEKKHRRYYAEIEKKRADKIVEAEQLRAQEIIIARKMEEERLATWENLRAYAEEQDFHWVKYAKKHQWEGALTAAINGSTLIADEMGLGKTLEYIMVCDLRKAKKVAVFAPNDVALNIYDDFRFWAPHRNVIPLKGGTKQIKEFMTPIIRSAEEITVVMNYETLWGRGAYNKDFLDALVAAEFDVIIADEAHVAKNEDGKNFEFLQKLRKTGESFYPVSGTFLLNSPEDLYTNLHLIDPNTFWDKYRFLNAYCQQDWDTGKYIFRSGGAESLMKKMGHRIIRRRLADTDIVLPDQHINEVLIPFNEIPASQRDVMEQLAKHAQLVIEESGESMSVAAQIALITRQRQASVWPAGIQIKDIIKDENGKKISEQVIFDAGELSRESIKMDYAIRLLKQRIKNGERCVVFSQFKTALVELENRLTAEGVSVCRFDGDTPDPVRQEIKKDFLRPADGIPQPNPKWNVVLANFRTGGVGLTFTEATYMLLLDEEWNPGKNAQAYARIHRIGQVEETTVDILRIEDGYGTIDMWMKTLNEMKQAIIDGLDEQIDMRSSLYNTISTGTIQLELAK